MTITDYTETRRAILALLPGRIMSLGDVAVEVAPYDPTRTRSALITLIDDGSVLITDSMRVKLP